jgi:ribulose bisphosphate carboxylase small subunit
MQTSTPATLLILVVTAVLAIGYLAGREYVHSYRFRNRHWK